MDIIRLQADDLFSYEHLDLPLSNLGLILIEGENGAGKSTIFRALMWVLFDETLSKQRGDEVIRWDPINKVYISGKTRGIIEIVVNEQKVRVERYRKHHEYKDKVLLFVDGKEITGSTNKHTQQLIQEILQLDVAAFLNCVLFPQGASGFSNKTDAEQKAILERILSIERFEKAHKIKKEQRDGLERSIGNCDTEIINLNLRIADAEGSIVRLREQHEQFEKDKKQKGLSEADMQRVAGQAGYTLQEAKAQLGKMSGINQMFDFKVRSGLFVSKRDVETYYNEHPETRPAEYCIMRAVVPFSDLEPKQETKQRLDTYVRTGKGNVRIAWSEPFWLKHDQIAQDKHFIYDMKLGHISRPIEVQNGFEVFKLVEKKPERLVPLKERYDEIANLLKSPKYQELLDTYKQELYDKATIVYY